MTALDRAKAFVQSRAAKTALRILPLALATVVCVNKAHANTQPVFSGSFSTWSSPACGSGGVATCLDPSSFASNQPTPYMTNGSQSSGVATGTYVVKGASGGPASLSFLMSGNGTGDLTGPVTVSYNFSISCPNCSSSDTFSATVSGDVENTASQSFTESQSGYSGPAGGNALGIFYIDPVAGTLQDWGTEIDFSWVGNAGETATIDLTRLDIYPTTGTSSVPEPGSLLLALSGLPLIGRLLRRKR